MKTVVIIPALNEAKSIGSVLKDIPDFIDEVIVADNGSTDDTAQVAVACGATVVHETKKGYGAACLKGIDYIKTMPEPPHAVVFLDADYSDHPEEMPLLLAPLEEGKADMVIGSRATGTREKGSMTPQQVFGNWLATTMMRWIFGAGFSDLGPFRAISWRALEQIGMSDKDYGWTVEMQLKAHLFGLRYTEQPVSYRKRIGRSKVSGTVKGTVMAGYKIISTIIRYGIRACREQKALEKKEIKIGN